MKALQYISLKRIYFTSGYFWIGSRILMIFALLCLFIMIYRNSECQEFTQITITHMNDDETDTIESKYTNIPLKYWLQVKKQSIPYRMNSTCAPFPNLLELEFTNMLWQSVRMSNATIQLFNAYYDNREITPGKSIRIPCMIDRNETFFQPHCQIWFEGESQPLITKVANMNYMFYKYWHMQQNGQYGPYLLECKIPKSHQILIPKVISVVENPCDSATNLLKVLNDQIPEEKKNFTVCVKGLDFLTVDLSARLVEWLEFTFLMGVDKVFLYKLQIHSNMQKVVDYYEKLGKVDIKPITLPEGGCNIPILQHLYITSHFRDQVLDEIIPYNDCFYRNIHTYKYVALLDIDEVIMPQKDNDWNGLMERIINKTQPGQNFASFNVRNVYFLNDMTPEGVFPDIPPYMHMLQHAYRSQNFTPSGCYVKSFFNTDYTISCHNHLPFEYSPKSIYSYDVQIEDAHMQHYRSNCAEDVDCNLYRNHIVKDIGMWRYKDVLIRNVNKALEEIGLLV